MTCILPGTEVGSGPTYREDARRLTENENVDGAALNNAIFGGKNGIMKGILNECKVYEYLGKVRISTGVIVVQGFRLKITEEWVATLNSAPVADTEFHIVVRLKLYSGTHAASAEIVLRENGDLVQENVFATESGVYEAEIATCTLTKEGSFVDVVQKMGFVSSAGAGLPDYTGEVTIE